MLCEVDGFACDGEELARAAFSRKGRGDSRSTRDGDRSISHQRYPAQITAMPERARNTASAVTSVMARLRQ